MCQVWLYECAILCMHYMVDDLEYVVIFQEIDQLISW